MNKLTFSLLLVGLFAVAALARTSPQIRRPFKFTPGQTYIYEYRGRQWNGIPKLNDQFAGLTLDCDVILQALPEQSGKEVLMKLDDIKIEQLHTQTLESNNVRKLNQGSEINTRQMTLYKEELSKPIRFLYQDGKVVSFIAETTDAEWSINIKKSILSLFQLDLAPTKIIKSIQNKFNEQVFNYQSEDSIRGVQTTTTATEMPLVYPIYEESFGGICETLYEIDSLDNVDRRDQKEYLELNDVLNVTKTVNFKNCLTDPSVSYDRHSFNVNTQTIKGKLFSKQPFSTLEQNYYPVPEELKSKYSNAYNSFDSKDNVASPVPVERYSWTKYNITTAPQSLVERRSVPVSSTSDMSLIEGIYTEGKIKYQADGDELVSETQQSLKLISCVPTQDLARVAPEISQLANTEIRQPHERYTTIQCELNSQKFKFYQTLYKYSQLQQTLRQTGQIGQETGTNGLYSHQLILPFALSASWYPVVASGSQSIENSLERTIEPEQLAKSYEHLLISIADDILVEDVAQSKKIGEKVVRLINVVSFMPKFKLVEVYDRIVERIQKAKQDQTQSQQRPKQALVDNELVSKWKIIRKLYLDSLPLAGSKQAIEMIELLIESQRVKSWEAKELCEAVPANLRYPDTEIIDAFIRISQLPQVRKSRSLFASCSIAVGKMIGQAYAKSKDASYKPTTYEPSQKLPTHLREDDLVRQVVEEADPRRTLPMPHFVLQKNVDLYDRLVLDEQDLVKYIKLYKQMLYKAQQYHEKVIYIETLAHMKVPQVLPILEPYVSGRLTLAQCLGNQPLDINRPVEQSQWYNYYGRQRFIKQQQQQQPQAQYQNSNQKDWSEEESYAAEECNYMRTIAIYAMAHVSHSAPGKVQALLLPVFDNTYEPYQIRIAAFTTMMMTPVEEHILERIASQMWREPSKEVASFVVGTIDTMSKLTSPMAAPYKYAAQKAAESMPKQYLDTWKFSWMAGGDHFNKQKQTGLTWLAEVIKSNVSSIPRAAYINFGKLHGPAGSKFDNQFEFGFTSKGLESLIKDYIVYNQQQLDGEGNILASIFENLYNVKDDIVKYYREARDSIKSSILYPEEQMEIKLNKEPSFYFNKRQQQPLEGVNSESGKQSRKLSQLFDSERVDSSMNSQRQKRSITFQARTSTDDDEEAKLTLFSKLFDSTSYHALDKKQILTLFEKSDDYLKMIADELIMGGKLHYVKMIMPSNMWHMVPSQWGIPIVVTHREPIVFSMKIDGQQNGQLTSTLLSQYFRQQVTGQQVPNVQGQNFVQQNGLQGLQGLNITALIHPKVMHSNYRFMFGVEQAQNEAYGVQTEKSNQISLPMELSVAYSKPKQLVSIALEPKTPTRMQWTKEVAKTFINKINLASSLASAGSISADNWLGQEHLIRLPSKQELYKRKQRPELYVPSILSSVQQFIQEPKDKQMKIIEQLETPFKFNHKFVQSILGLEFQLDGATDDEEVVESLGKPELYSKQSHSQRDGQQFQWSSTDSIDDLDQHSKSGPFGEYLHVLDSIMTRPSKYLEFYTTLKPENSQSQPQSKSPVYRFDFVLSGKQQSMVGQQQQQQIVNSIVSSLGRRSPVSTRLDGQSSRMWETMEQGKKLNRIQQQQQQPIMLEVY